MKTNFKSKWLYLLPSLFSAIVSVSANALPLLAENAAQNFNGIVTLYPDSDKPNLFYFMPNSSQFVVNDKGVPLFSLTYWGISTPSTNAGGYMVMDLKPRSDADQKAALNAFLSSGRSIAVLPVQASTLSLTSTNGSSPPLGALFSEWNFSKAGGRAEDEEAVNAILTPIGAQVLKHAIETPEFLKLDYCYQVTGLGPNFHAHIHFNWKTVYTDLQTHAEGGSWFVRAALDAEVENLIRDHHITIQIDGGDAKDEEYVHSVADKIAARLFVPELQTTPTPGKSSPTWSFTRVSLSATSKTETKDEDYDLIRRENVTKEFCLPLSLTSVKDHIGEVLRDADKD